jgi:hypothetical protein
LITGREPPTTSLFLASIPQIRAEDVSFFVSFLENALRIWISFLGSIEKLLVFKTAVRRHALDCQVRHRNQLPKKRQWRD